MKELYHCGILSYVDDVVELDMSNFGLSGTIPPEIGSFINLNYLNLSNNNLNGAIPSELGDLNQPKIFKSLI